jgi:hypothetical protein
MTETGGPADQSRQKEGEPVWRHPLGEGVTGWSVQDRRHEEYQRAAGPAHHRRADSGARRQKRFWAHLDIAALLADGEQKPPALGTTAWGVAC